MHGPESKYILPADCCDMSNQRIIILHNMVGLMKGGTINKVGSARFAKVGSAPFYHTV